MGSHPNIYLLITLLLAIVFYARQDDLRYKQYCIVLASGIFVLSVSLAVFVTALLAALFVHFFARRVDKSQSILYVGCLALSLLPVFVTDLTALDSRFEVIEFLGGGFLGVRSFLLFKGLSNQKLELSFMSILTYLLFFPVFLAGPIERADALDQKLDQARFNLTDIAQGLLRFFAGLVKIYLLAALMSSFSTSLQISDNFTLWNTWIFCLSNWFLLYFLFSGYADTAIGTSKIFGLTIRENFNFPFLARSIQDYWQRWHITLMEVASENVYRPFVRKTGRRAVGFYLSFFVMAMWHAVSLNFFLWGLIHASSFAMFFFYSRSKLSKRMWKSEFFNHRLVKHFWAVISIVITLSCVSFASTIGTTGLLQLIMGKLS